MTHLAPETTELVAPASTRDEGRVVLEANGVAKTYRRGWRRDPLRVLSDANLALRSGEIVGLVGENGSGKSTFMKILVGSLRQNGGEVTRTGTIGYCPQEPILYERLTCDEHFELFARAYRLDPAFAERSRDDIYEILGFGDYRSARVEELSGGTRAKLNLGMALLADPDILLLDEPYAGFDWDTYLKFWDLAGQRRDSGRSVLIISHFVVDEERFDRVIHLREGKTTS